MQRVMRSPFGWRRAVSIVLVLLLTCLSCRAEPDVPMFPSMFAVRDIQIGDACFHVRIGGGGDAVVLLHGFGETGDMWAPLAAALAQTHMVIVPDLRGMGLSSRPPTGYDKKSQAQDLARLLDRLGVQAAALVTHDIGNMVGYAFAAQFPARVSRFVLLDAPIPGIGPWDEIAKRHALWHWSFWGVDAERLVAGRERIYLDRFWNDFTASGNHYPEALRQHLAALYALPGAMHAAFEQFKAFDQDVLDNRALAARGKLPMPVLAIGGERSYGATMATILREVAADVTGRIIPGAAHWLLEERPAEVTAMVQTFLQPSGKQ